MRNWNQLGVVETIYEDEYEFSSSSSHSVASPSSPAPLHSRVEAWSLKTGRETDVLVHVQGICFRLHKDRVVSQSSYLKRRLTETSDLTLSPPLNITAETFAAVAEFCYNGKIQMTPSNIAGIKTAAELLGMTAGEGLSHVAETYFGGVICSNEEYALLVLRSCLPLLPEAETTAFLASRCIEALVSGDSYECVLTRLKDVVEMKPRDFQTVVESINRRFGNHDLLYSMVDLYLKENNYGNKLTEEQKIAICNSIDCTKLSTGTLVDCVQNPRMPLRFVVRAVLVEHLNNRYSIASVSAQHHQLESEQSNKERQQGTNNSVTLGDILRRDAALRQTAQLKEAMESTNARIQCLEKELRSMNKVLVDQSREEERNVLASERSASFHFGPNEINGRIQKGERWSLSSSDIRFDATMESCQLRRSSFSPSVVGNGNTKMSKNFRQRFMTGLKNAFRVPNSTSS